MARYNIKAIDLAQEMGISANAVSNLRKGNTMPRLDGDSLNKLCNALNKLALDLDEEITPVTLIDYTRDLEPDDEQKSAKTSLKTQKTNKVVNSEPINYPNSVLSAITEAKSA
jgi:putative transcriptional regulator